jgi:hypothetical protein
MSNTFWETAMPCLKDGVPAGISRDELEADIDMLLSNDLTTADQLRS